MIRVVLCSEHPFVRACIRWFLSFDPNLNIVGEAKCTAETIQMCASFDPHILLVDIRNAEDALAIHQELQCSCPQMGIILLGSWDQSSSVLELLRTGIKGYLLCEEAGVHFLEAIHTVRDGGTWISETISDLPQTRPCASNNHVVLPTKREVDVIHLLGQGLSNVQIAEHMKLSESTVRFHLRNLMKKLCVRNRTEMIIAAIRRGWIDVQKPPEYTLSEATGGNCRIGQLSSMPQLW